MDEGLGGALLYLTLLSSWLLYCTATLRHIEMLTKKVAVAVP